MSSTTEELLDRHLDCFGRGDLDGIVADYSSTAVMFTPRGPLKGPAAIRSLFQAIFAEFGKPGTTFFLQLRSIDGDYAYILWRAETADDAYEAVADTFVMRNGQIILHSFGGKIQAKNAPLQ
jgi:ketosteroid isomerase-like protein